MQLKMVTTYININTIIEAKGLMRDEVMENIEGDICIISSLVY